MSVPCAWPARLPHRGLLAAILLSVFGLPPRLVAMESEFLNAAPGTAVVPAGRRAPADWPVFAVSETPVALRVAAPTTLAAGTTSWLRLTTAIDDRKTRLIEVAGAKSGRVFGRLDLRFAPALEIFQLRLKPADVAEIREDGITLRLVDAGTPLWFFATPAADSLLPKEFRPQVVTFSGQESPLAEFHRRMASLASLQPWGWMEGCVLEGLRDLAQRSPKPEPYLAAREAHWRVFVPTPGKLVYENPNSQPGDQRIHSIEDGLPFADLALRDPSSPVVDLFVDYCRRLRRSDHAIQGGNTLSAEGTYTIAYPLAVIAAARRQPDLAQLALEQLDIRRERLWHDGAPWLRYHDDGRWTFRAWARGVAWHMLGTCRSIEPLRQHVSTETAEAELRRLATWVMAHQRPDGLWSCFLEDATTAPDTSGSAGIAAALAHGARLGVLPPEARASAQRALTALVQHLTPDGLLDGVAQSNRGGEALQRSDYRVISPMGMGLLAQLVAACGDMP